MSLSPSQAEVWPKSCQINTSNTRRFSAKFAHVSEQAAVYTSAYVSMPHTEEGKLVEYTRDPAPDPLPP